MAQEDNEVRGKVEDSIYPHKPKGRNQSLLEQQLASQVTGSRQCSCSLTLTFCSPELSFQGIPWLPSSTWPWGPGVYHSLDPKEFTAS